MRQLDRICFMTSPTIGLSKAFQSFQTALNGYRVWTSASHVKSPKSVTNELVNKGESLELASNQLETAIKAATKLETMATKLHEPIEELSFLTHDDDEMIGPSFGDNLNSKLDEQKKHPRNNPLNESYNEGLVTGGNLVAANFRRVLDPIIQKFRALVA